MDEQRDGVVAPNAAGTLGAPINHSERLEAASRIAVEALRQGSVASNQLAELFPSLRFIAHPARGVRARPQRRDLCPLLAGDLSARNPDVVQSGEHNSVGRIQIKSKDECRKRLGRSPDRADSVAFAHWHASTADHVSGWCYMGGRVVNLLTGEERPSNIHW